MDILALYSIKGGVGKTAASVNLADRAALGGLRVLIWDLDPQGAATFYFRIRPEVAGGATRLLRKKKRLARAVRGTDFEGLDLIPADFSYRHLDLELDGRKDSTDRLAKLLATLAPSYDLAILDCPPSISLASEGVFRAATALVVPTIPTVLSLNTLNQLTGYLQNEGPPGLEVWPFFSMLDRRKSLHRDTCAAAESTPYDFLETAIPYASDVERMGIHRQPLTCFAPRSPASKAFADLWSEIQERLAERT